MVSGIVPHSYGLAALLGQDSARDTEQKAESAATSRQQAKASPTAPHSAVTVTLSEQARAAVAAADPVPQTAVVSAARRDLDALLKAANAASALKDGRPTIDLSGQSRRSLWAIATNAEAKFTVEERVVATLEMNKRRDTNLATPAAAVRVTGDYASLYRGYLSNLDAAGPEEKATTQWSEDRAAVLKGLDASITRPRVMPAIAGDPVATYLKESGSVVFSPRTRDIDDIAADVRAVLDGQYAAADRDDSGGDGIDFLRFDDRSLAAVALNKGGLFSDRETALAAAEVKDRSWGSVSRYYADAKSSSDPAAFGKSLMTRYSAMSDEERQAAGWTPAFYDRLTALQNLRDKIAALFDGGAGPGSSLLDYI